MNERARDGPHQKTANTGEVYMSDTPITPLLISKDRAAKLIDASVDYVESLIRDGLVRAVKTGRVTRIRYEDVETLPDRLPTVRYRQKEATS